MSNLTDIQNTIRTELDCLNQRIYSQLLCDNELMNNVIKTFLKAKGKQIRPIIVLLTAKMFGEVNDKVLAAAASVELLHNASLIHDDVVDNSMLRRNLPTINSIWDNHIAVLVGDFFVSSAMQQAIMTNDINVIDSLCYLGKLLSLGELDQIYNARYHHLTEDSYFKIIDYKTASLFVACAKMGCFAVGADEASTKAMAEFARLLGLCFQIRDDIYDYYEDAKVGKPTGNDLREGKITLPLLHVLLDEKLPHNLEMRELSTKENLSAEEISQLLDYAKENGGIDYAYQTMAKLRKDAADIISELPQNRASASLLEIFDSIIKR